MLFVRACVLYAETGCHLRGANFVTCRGAEMCVSGRFNPNYSSREYDTCVEVQSRILAEIKRRDARESEKHL